MDPYLGEIKLFALNYAPQGWHLCDGSVLPIQGNQALFSLLGISYGGNGTTNFGLPDLRGRVPAANGYVNLGTKGGEETVTLTTSTVPPHTHNVNVSANAGNQPGGLGNHFAAAVTQSDSSGVNLYATSSANQVALTATTMSSVGLSAAHDNMQPYLALSYCIATTGIYPTRP